MPTVVSGFGTRGPGLVSYVILLGSVFLKKRQMFEGRSGRERQKMRVKTMKMMTNSTCLLNNFE